MEPTIRATNKKTGQVFEGSIEEARKFGFSDKFIQSKLESAAKLERTIETGDPFAETGDQKGREVGKISAKDKALAETGISHTKELAKLFEKDPDILIKQLIPGKLASREWDTFAYDAADALLRLRTGAQANPTEIRGYMKTIAPSLGDSPEVVEKKLNKMLDDFAFYTDKEQKDISLKKKRGFLYNLLVKPYETTAANIGALGQVGASKLLGMFDPQAGAKLAQEGQFGERVAERQRLATEKPLQALFDQALASADIALQAKGLKGIKAARSARVAGKGVGAGQKIVTGAEKIRSKLPKNILARRQAEAAAETVGKVKPNVNKLIKVGKNLASKDPDIAREFAKQKAFLTKKTIKDIPALLDRMQVWGRTAYLKGGGIKSAAKADLYDKLYKEGIGQLKTLAPEVYKQRQLLRLTFELPKNLGKALWKLTLGKVITTGL